MIQFPLLFASAVALIVGVLVYMLFQRRMCRYENAAERRRKDAMRQSVERLRSRDA